MKPFVVTAIGLTSFMPLVFAFLDAPEGSNNERIRKALVKGRNIEAQETREGVLQARAGYKRTGGMDGNLTDTADLTIDLQTIDTSQFSGMYRFWMEVPLYRFEESPFIDADHDGRKEIYGGFKDYSTPIVYSRIYEFNGDSAFIFAYQYADSLLGPIAGADIDGDSLVDMVYYRNLQPILVGQTQTNQQSLPTVEKFSYFFGGGVYEGRADFCDLDSDGLPEMIYLRNGAPDSTHTCGQANYIERYDSARNSFRVVYCNNPNNSFSAGFAFADFDLDGKQNFSNGGIDGELFVYEHQVADSFSVILADTTATSNAYLAAFTNDLDANGKPEIWIGGDTYINSVPVTRLFLYETNGNDSYHCVYRIDILGVFSFYAGNIVVADMDNDGMAEVILCIDQHVLVFKNNGPRSYALWYMRLNELAAAGLSSVIYNASAADFDNDGYPEILVTMDQINTLDQIRYFTRIYKYNQPTSVADDDHGFPVTYRLDQNYPNPFNPATSIRFGLANATHVVMKLYDVLGQEVATLVDEAKSVGYHEVILDASQLASGIYFYKMAAGEFVAVRKLVVMK